MPPSLPLGVTVSSGSALAGWVTSDKPLEGNCLQHGLGPLAGLSRGLPGPGAAASLPGPSLARPTPQSGVGGSGLVLAAAMGLFSSDPSLGCQIHRASAFCPQTCPTSRLGRGGTWEELREVPEAASLIPRQSADSGGSGTDPGTDGGSDARLAWPWGSVAVGIGC